MLDKFSEGELTKLVKSVSLTATANTDAVLPVMQIQYYGPALYAKVAVAITTGDITLTADDTDGETTTVLTVDVSNASYNTWGEVRDAINATGLFRCFLIGVLPSGTSTAMLDTLAATSCKTDNGLTLYLDLALTGICGFAITNQKFVSRPEPDVDWASTVKNFEQRDVGWTKDKGGKYNSQCENALNFLDFNVTSVGDGTILIYGVDDTDDTEVLLWKDAYASGTAEEHGTDPGDVFVKAPQGMRLVVLIDRTTDANDITALDIQAIGTTKDMVGGQVHPANYTGCA